MKFGRKVKFTVSNDVLEEYQIAADVQQLSELVDKIKDKSNRICVVDLLSNISSSVDSQS
ncbi:hypothetical protein JXA56_01560 [Candidatus Micrarchaeota archaeon]|nr:hypothetical protein [Candidatus Micrarchaeota archaeon]